MSENKQQQQEGQQQQQEGQSDVSASDSLVIVVLGASGDLAQKKTYPTLLALFQKGLLPKNTFIYGYSRTKMSDDQLREKLKKHLKDSKEEEKNKQRDAFLGICHYYAGGYDDVEAMKGLSQVLSEKESSYKKKNRIFYMAIPPSVFLASAKSIKEGAVTKEGWNRVVIEKPFGKDYESAKQLSVDMDKLFDEESIYRIDHYLGKDMVQNLMVLRFANTIFEPLWNNNNIANVVITFKEDIGTEGRAGYFNEYGIIRDVMQNHLMQMLALVAMEPPVSLSAEDVRDEKVKVLRHIPPLKMENLVFAQYGKGKKEGQAAYLDEQDVPKDSVTPTFATAVLFINNSRWGGVPFILKCGKGLDARKAEIRIQFKTPYNNLFRESHEAPNELIIRVQPNEAVYMKLLTKQPGLTQAINESELDLTYKSRFGDAAIPDAYERLILDVTRGDHSLFVREDELSVAWRIFTPVLHEIEKGHKKPETYEFGSRGPQSSDDLIKKYGFRRYEKYFWQPNAKV